MYKWDWESAGLGECLSLCRGPVAKGGTNHELCEFTLWIRVKLCTLWIRVKLWFTLWINHCVCYLLILQRLMTNLAPENNKNLLSDSSGVQKSKIGPQSSFFFPGGSRTESVSLPFAAPRGCLHSLVHGPASFWPLHPSSHLFLWLWPSCLHLIRTLWLHWAHLDHPVDSPHLMIPNSVTSARSLMPHKIM